MANEQARSQTPGSNGAHRDLREQELSSLIDKVDGVVLLHLFTLVLIPAFTVMVLIIAYRHLAWVWVAAHVVWVLLSIKIVDAHHRLLQRNYERRLAKIEEEWNAAHGDHEGEANGDRRASVGVENNH